MKDARDILRPYVADMAAVEKHILEAIERQRNDDDVKQLPQALQLVSRLETTLKRHVDSLESHLKQFEGGGVAGTVKETVTGVLGVFAGLYDKVRKDTVSRMLRDDYTALNLAAVSLTMLHTTALAVHHQTTADLALRNLKEITPLVMELGMVIPHVVVRELAEDGRAYDAAIAQQAVRNIEQAWQTQPALATTGATF
jgi:ferritin-like metal-binding protein YciE